MNSYIPDILPEEDVEQFSKADFGESIGWGETVGLVIVDMTREFTSADSELGREDTADEAIDAIHQLLQAYRNLDQPVFYTTPESYLPRSYPGTTKATLIGRIVVRGETRSQPRSNQPRLML